MVPVQSILHSYFRGEASPEEADMVDAWRASSSSNQATFDQLWRLWQLADKPYQQPVVKDEWNRLMHTMHTPPGLGKAVAIKKMLLISTGAALLAVLVFIYWPSAKKGKAATVAKQSAGNLVKDTVANYFTAVLDTYSSVHYPLTAPNGQLMVDVDGGGAFFNNTSSKENGLSVMAGTVKLVPGMGSSFYVTKDTVSDRVEAMAAEGTLTVTDGTHTIQLQKDEAVEYSNKQHAFGNKQAANINRFSYATKVFYFNNTPLKEAVAYLAKAYNLAINIKAPVVADCRITTQFDNKSIEYIMDIMSATLHFDYEFISQGKAINITGQGCY